MKTATETAELVRSGKLKAEESVKEIIANIDKKDGEIRAYLEVFREEAISRAREIDRKIAGGKPAGKLVGVCVAIKDNIQYKGHISSCGSKILENYISPYNSTAVEKLLAEDAIIIGRTNMDEFAMGSSCENSAFGITRNPLDLSRAPGGSSGGSTAAVCADMAHVALGSETGGSIRQPAAFCGVVGFKPSYGAVSRYGLTALASSLDQIGPIARNARDCALLFSVIAGKDERDETSADVSPDDIADIAGLRAGIAREYFGEGLDADVKKLVMSAVDKLKKAGAQVKEINLPHSKYCIPAYYVIVPAEASSNLARFDGVRYGLRAEGANIAEEYANTRHNNFGAEVKRRIMLGTYVLSAGYYDAYYVKARKTQQLIKQDFDRAFNEVDVIISPATPTTAFKLGEKINDPVAMYLNDIYTAAANLAGICAVAVPCGKTDKGLPASVQIIGQRHKDRRTLSLAEKLENIL